MSRDDAGNPPASAQPAETREEIARLTQELEDTNRGVLALYAELEDRAGLLRTANELKDQFLSHLSHEFRTPLNSIIALSGLLLESNAGGLHDEQRTQASLIKRSALDLLGMVNNLLDLAKIEAGHLEVNVEDVEVAEIFSGLRGVLRPLVAPGVDLIFDDCIGISFVQTDRTKVTQILRNLISNALKFTTAGEVRVAARRESAECIVFTVRDTGIGIPEAERERIFHEFAQVDNELQRNATGTGLGLSLSRKLANAIGASLRVESEVGAGSTFTLELPTLPPL